MPCLVPDSPEHPFRGAEPQIRPAHRGDAIALEALVGQALQHGAAGHYSPIQRQALGCGPMRIDPRLIEDGTFWVADAQGRIVACAGWTARADDADHQRLARQADGRTAAFLRSVLVHPRCAGRGWARRLVAWVEADAVRHGIQRSLLLSTLNAVPVYARLGYRPLYGFEHTADGVPLAGLAMGRDLQPDAVARIAA